MARCATCRAKLAKNVWEWCSRCGSPLVPDGAAWELGPYAGPMGRRPFAEPSASSKRRERWKAILGTCAAGALIVLAGIALGTTGEGAAGEVELFPAYDNAAEKYGFIDKTGAMVVQPRFTRAEPFSEGRRRHSRRRCLGLHQRWPSSWERCPGGLPELRSGRVPVRWCLVGASPFSEGLAAVSRFATAMVDQPGRFPLAGIALHIISVIPGSG